ncbi:sugar transferase [Pirellulales bacterium]|nr:sugar transferase [Pirellulales bacterium]
MYPRYGKRLFDFAAAAAALALLAPLFVALYLAVRWRLGSPALFRQERPGRNGVSFTLYKFRSMTDARDPHGNLTSDADRLTPFGKWLRSTSLDELPELWNVLRGEMSLVGPRPLLTEYLPHYSPEQARRHDVRPGLTGWAQVNGRNASDWESRFCNDVWYVDHASLALDLWILARTVWQVVARRNINAAGHATMPPFAGTPFAGPSFAKPASGLRRAA